MYVIAFYCAVHSNTSEKAGLFFRSCSIADSRWVRNAVAPRCTDETRRPSGSEAEDCSFFDAGKFDAFNATTGRERG